MHLKTIVLCIVITMLVIPASTMAQDQKPGFDLFLTLPGPGTFWDFAGHPLPADFFSPGSDPFPGNVLLRGQPIIADPNVPGNLGNADTIVERQDTLRFPTIGSTDVIPIEIVALDLRSITPITVTSNGGFNPELWDVQLQVSPNGPSNGTMTATKTHANGGTFSANLFVQPRFTFTRQSDGAIVVLDGPQNGYNDMWNTAGVPWDIFSNDVICLEPGCNIAFAHDGVSVPSQYAGPQSGQGFTNGCPSTVVPTLSQWGMILAALGLLGTGVVAIVRRRRSMSRVS